MSFALFSSQAKAQQVIAPAGGYFQSDNLLLSFTLGEPVIETFQNDELTLTQGFQQPYNFYLQQILNIPAGWSDVSTYLDPLNKGVEGMFSPFDNDFIILSSMTDFYYPAVGVNTIGNWNFETGYQIKAANNLELTVAGTKTENPTLELVQGWNLIPVLNSCNNPAEELFNPIIEHLQIVKEVAGWGVYWPQFGVNTLGELIPGKAYFVLVDEDVELEFLPCTPANMTPSPALPLQGKGGGPRTGTNTGAVDGAGQRGGTPSDKTPSISPLRGRTSQRTGTGQRVGTPSPQGEGWGEVQKTPITHIIAIPAQVLTGLENGDIIAIYNQNGLCCGAVSYQNQNLALTVFGDDPTTPQVDGMVEGESLQFRVINPETGKESTLEAEFDEQMPQSGYFTDNGISAVKSLESTGIEEFAGNHFNISVYPNPSNGIFNILTGYDNQETNWQIVGMDGAVILYGSNETTQFTIDLSTYPKGIYYLKITQGGLQTVKKLVVQ